MKLRTGGGASLPTPDEFQIASKPAFDERAPWLLCVYCLLLTVIPADVVSKELPANLGTPARLVVALLGFVAIAGFIAPNQNYAAGIRVNPGIVLLGVYLSLTLIVWGEGLLLRGSVAQELAKSTAFSSAITGVCIAAYTIVQLSSTRRRSIVLACLLTGITFSAVVGILQHTMRLNLEYALTPPGFETLGLNFAGVDPAGVVIRRGSVRAFGTFLNALPYGTACALSVPLAIHFARYSSRHYGRLLGAAAALILLIAVPTSIARSSLIVLAVAVSFYAISLTLSRIAAMLIGIAGVVLFIALASFSTLQSLGDTIVESADDPSVLVRYVQNDLMLSIFEQHPISGLGLGSITVSDFGSVDNSTVILLAEGGILGAAAYGALAVGGVFGIAGGLRRSATKKERDQTYAVGAMFLGLLAAAPTFSVLGHDPTYSMFFLLFGVLWSGCSYAIRRDPVGSHLQTDAH